jgi:hypothetical protein
MRVADDVQYGPPLPGPNGFVTWDGRRCGACGLIMSWWRRRNHWRHRNCPNVQRYWTSDGRPQAVMTDDGHFVGWVDQAG